MFRKHSRKEAEAALRVEQASVLNARLSRIAADVDKGARSKRNLNRKNVLHLALVTLEDESVINCTIVDANAEGYKLRLHETMELPTSFRIRIPVLEVDCLVDLRWQSDNEAGVEIMNALGSSLVEFGAMIKNSNQQ